MSGVKRLLEDKQEREAMKTRIDLLPHEAIRECGLVMAYGASKHRPGSWRSLPWRTHAEKAHRHLNSFMCGQFIDPDSGLPHLANAAVRLLMLLELYRDGLGLTDDEASAITGKGCSPLPGGDMELSPRWSAQSPYMRDGEE